uniref:Uncharacterized protein n=1 Tax=Panagrolaimus sp. PS1159 TaxID=55785 RepID=A0AC35FQS0_9BILA
MKRSHARDEPEEGEIIEKQPRRSSRSSNDLPPSNEKNSRKSTVESAKTLLPLENSMKQRNSDAESLVDLPSLNDSILNTKSDDYTATIVELRHTISSKDTTIFNLQKCLEEAYAVQENLKDDKREAISEKENFKNRNNELREAAKAAKDKITKLEAQLEEVHEKLGKCQNDIDQESHEISMENETLNNKVSGLKEAIKEKNQTIAQLQKDLNVSQVLNEGKLNEEKQSLEAKLEHANLAVSDILKEYKEMKAQFDREKLADDEKIKKLETKIESLKDKIEDLSDQNYVILSEKQMIEKDLETSRKEKADEVSALIRQNEEKDVKYEELKQKLKEFSEQVYSMNEEEASRTTQLVAELIDAKEEQTKIQQKYNEFKAEKEAAAQALRAEQAILADRDWKEKVGELQKFVNNLHSLCNK